MIPGDYRIDVAPDVLLPVLIEFIEEKIKLSLLVLSWVADCQSIDRSEG